MSDKASEVFPPDARILLIDDSTFSQNNITSDLKGLGYKNLYNVRSAKDAQAFLQSNMVQNQPIHLIVCDIHMPNMSGLAFLHWLRGQDPFKDIPVIVLTSSTEKTEILEAARHNISHYLLKPCAPAVLMEKLKIAWQRHGQKYYETTKSR